MEFFPEKKNYKSFKKQDKMKIAGHNVYSSQKSSDVMSELAMVNVEALASGEGGNHITCYSGNGSTFLCKCNTCTWGYIGTSKKSTCY